MKNKYIYIFSLILGVFILSGCSLVSSDSKKTALDSSNNNQVTASTTQTFAMEEVAQANTADKCWTVINGNVYDLTSFVNKHKGGSKNILNTCGVDSTSAYDNQHGGQEKANNVLANFLIGKLN